MTEERTSTTRVALIPAQRHAMILQWLQTDGAVSVQQLADAIGASVSTLRRDLETLEAAGFVDRSFGGASLRAHALTTLEPGHAVATHIRHDEKAAIGMLAARAIMARNIPLTAMTNDLAVAQMLAGAPQIKVIVVGGVVRSGSMTLFGAPGEEFLLGVKADVALMGAHAVTPDGVSEATIEITRVKQLILRAARTTRVLVDHTKLKEPALFRICGLESIDEIITDASADAGICMSLRERGPRISVASPPGA